MYPCINKGNVSAFLGEKIIYTGENFEFIEDKEIKRSLSVHFVVGESYTFSGITKKNLDYDYVYIEGKGSWPEVCFATPIQWKQIQERKREQEVKVSSEETECFDPFTLCTRIRKTYVDFYAPGVFYSSDKVDRSIRSLEDALDTMVVVFMLDPDLYSDVMKYFFMRAMDFGRQTSD